MADVKGINFKVWNIHSNTKHRNTSDHLSASLNYILNKEKVGDTRDVGDDFFSDSEAQLDREIGYVENDIKTADGALVGCVNLLSSDVKGAVSEMLDVKKFFNKMEKNPHDRAALHGVISLDAAESDAKNAANLMQLCDEMLRELFPEHQAIYAVHTNTEHLHIHFIVNSVGLNGKKIHQPEGFIRNSAQPCINRLAKKYGFTQNEKWKEEKNKNITGFAKIKIKLRNLIDIAIENSNDFDEFIKYLRDEGVSVNVGKHISLKIDGMNKAIRSHQLGADYTVDAIAERLRTKKDALNQFNNSYSTFVPKKSVNFQSKKIKKFKDLSGIERKRYVKLLRLGRNPWNEERIKNWQLSKISKELNRTVYAYDAIKFYSSNNMSVEKALDNILALKKEINEERKIMRQTFRRYKPIVDLYQEMEKIERQAYLYDHEGYSQYRVEFEKYRDLTQRLKNGYNKSINDVKTFIENYNNHFDYTTEQLKQLSNDYISVKKYGQEHGIRLAEKGNFLDMVDVYNDVKLYDNHVYTTDNYYLTSSTSSCYARVTKKPALKADGKIFEAIEVTIYNSSGQVVESKNNNEGNKEFFHNLNRIKSHYGFKDCNKYNSVRQAFDYVNEITRQTVPNKPNQEYLQSRTMNRKTYSFTQGINYKSHGKDTKVHYMIDSNNPEYMMRLISNENEIKIMISDLNGKLLYDTSIPGFNNRNSQGFKVISEIKNKYQFSDSVLCFNRQNDVVDYLKSNNMQRNKVK